MIDHDAEIFQANLADRDAGRNAAGVPLGLCGDYDPGSNVNLMEWKSRDDEKWRRRWEGVDRDEPHRGK